MVGPDLIGDRYRLGELIAERDDASLYAARDEVAGGEVVVELLEDDPIGDPTPADEILRRARAAGALTHPGIARVRDAGTHRGRPYVVTEPVVGRSLATVMRTDDAVSLRQALTWGIELLAALEHAHESGVAHGDLRPARVLVTPEERIVVTGWADLQPLETRDPRNDLVRTAEIIHELVAGRDDGPVPRRVEEVVLKAMSPDSEYRFRSAAEMRTALGSIPVEEERANSLSTGVEEPSGTTVWPIPGRRYDPTRLGRRVIAFAVVLALIALGAFFLRVATRVSDEDRPPPPSPPPTTTDPPATGWNPMPLGGVSKEREDPGVRLTFASRGSVDLRLGTRTSRDLRHEGPSIPTVPDVEPQTEPDTDADERMP